MCVLILLRLCRLAAMDTWLWHTLITSHAFGPPCTVHFQTHADLAIQWQKSYEMVSHIRTLVTSVSRRIPQISLHYYVTPMNHTIDNFIYRLHHFSHACISSTQPTQLSHHTATTIGCFEGTKRTLTLS